MKGVFIKDLDKYVDTETAREYFASKKHKKSNIEQILNKLDLIMEKLNNIEKELKQNAGEGTITNAITKETNRIK